MRWRRHVVEQELRSYSYSKEDNNVGAKDARVPKRAGSIFSRGLQSLTVGHVRSCGMDWRGLMFSRMWRA
jgi:hypothetical protein